MITKAFDGKRMGRYKNHHFRITEVNADKYVRSKQRDKKIILLLFQIISRLSCFYFLTFLNRAILTQKMRDYCGDDMELRKATLTTEDELGPGSDEPLGDFEEMHHIYMPYVPVPGESLID